MTPPVVTLLTDYGLQDEFVGACHGVIARICPEARIIDVTHGIAPQDVLGGALRLGAALPYLPAGVHVAVVDPGVGSERRAVALRCADGNVFVGPDNGLLWPATQRGGGIIEAVEISESRFRLELVSATFHGRDIFAPVAAHLAAGRGLSEAGRPLDPAEMVQLQIPAARLDGSRLIATVLLVDRFGNLQLNFGTDRPRFGSELLINGQPVRYGRMFADAEPGELILYADGAGHLAVAVNQGSAAERLGVGPGSQLELDLRGTGDDDQRP